jgi:hypothetical protein
MRAIDLAEMLRKLLDVKINKCRKEMLYLHANRSGKNTGPDNGVSVGPSKNTGYRN